MDRYRAILNTVDGEVVADMVKGVCAGYYLADDVDKRIAELETGKAFDKAKIAEQKLRIAELREELFNTTADLETAQAKLDAIKPYAMHDEDCSKTMIKRRCSCGLDAALNGEGK